MVFKCKMCGGDIEPIENTNTGKCLYCKSVMTLPNLNDEKIVNLYNRANNLRLNNEFDKAYGVYETILEIDNKQVEAHWGLVITKYGVEYVDDPKTKKKIPTCHRTILDSIYDDVDYKYVLKESYGEALELYKKEANQINEIQKKILDISSKETPYDIFICYKETEDNGERTTDSVIAQEIYEKLVSLNYKVFFSRITLEDKLGEEFEPYIFSALNSAKVMLVVGTSLEHFEAVWVKNEWSRYLELMKKDRSKVLIPVYSKIDAYELPESFSMLQSQNYDKVGALQDLIHGIEKIIENKKHNQKEVINEEMFQKFKQMLADEERAKLEENSKLYETNVLKIKPSKAFIITSLLVSVIIAIWMISTQESHFLITFPVSTNILGIDRSLLNLFSIQFLVATITFIAFFAGFLSQKSHRISKYLYFSNIILELIFIIVIYFKNYRPSYIFDLIFILNLILLLYNPKWKIETKIELFNKEEKESQEEENKTLKENFVEKYKYSIHPVFMVLGISILIISIIFTNINIKSQTNLRDMTKEQIQITSEVRIREERTTLSNPLGRVYKGEIYTVLSKKEAAGHEWAEIITETGIHGFISISENNIIYLDKNKGD